jgi:hypothetical protein
MVGLQMLRLEEAGLIETEVPSASPVPSAAGHPKRISYPALISRIDQFGGLL